MSQSQLKDDTEDTPRRRRWEGEIMALSKFVYYLQGNFLVWKICQWFEIIDIRDIK